MSTTNPAIAADGSNAKSAPPPKTNPHVCNKPYAEVEDFNLDLSCQSRFAQCFIRLFVTNPIIFVKCNVKSYCIVMHLPVTQLELVQESCCLQLSRVLD